MLLAEGQRLDETVPKTACQINGTLLNKVQRTRKKKLKNSISLVYRMQEPKHKFLVYCHVNDAEKKLVHQ